MLIQRGAPNTAVCRRLMHNGRSDYAKRNCRSIKIVDPAVRFAGNVRIVPGGSFMGCHGEQSDPVSVAKSGRVREDIGTRRGQLMTTAHDGT